MMEKIRPSDQGSQLARQWNGRPFFFFFPEKVASLLYRAKVVTFGG